MTELIDRQTAFEVLTEYYHHATETQHTALREALDRVPSADAQPVRHGRWILVTNGRGGHECDKCHTYAPSYQTGKEHLTRFCPDCGARMDGEKNG